MIHKIFVGSLMFSVKAFSLSSSLKFCAYSFGLIDRITFLVLLSNMDL